MNEVKIIQVLMDWCGPIWQVVVYIGGIPTVTLLVIGWVALKKIIKRYGKDNIGQFDIFTKN